MIKNIYRKNGHSLLDKISKNANYLINNEINSSSEKNKFVIENNIPIISEKEMISLLDEQIHNSFFVQTKSDIRITHNLDSRINIEELVGYYNKYPSKNKRVVKIEYLEDIDIDENSLFFKFDKHKNNYTKCSEDVEVGDFLLLDSGEIVLVSKHVEEILYSKEILVEGVELEYNQSSYKLDVYDTSDFERIYGHKLPPRNNKKKRPYAMDSTLEDLRNTFIGRRIANVVLKEGQKEMLDISEPWMVEVAQKTLRETPLRMLALFSDGKVSFNMLEGIIDIANLRILKGIKTDER